MSSENLKEETESQKKHNPTEEDVIASLLDEQREMPRIPTIEEVATAIRKLTADIERQESLRTKLRARFRKMASDL